MVNPKELICPNCYHIGMTKEGLDRRGKQRWGCKACRSKTVHPICDADHDIVRENVRLSKQKQKAQDKNRIFNKSFREHARIENAVEEYSKELIKLFENNDLHETLNKFKVNNKAVGVIQFSDVHFNELVELENNRYDFKVASSRVRYFVNRARMYFKTANITNVVMALTGDLMNSDRRLDELLNQATNRAKATFLGVDILQQAILDLNEDFNDGRGLQGEEFIDVSIQQPEVPTGIDLQFMVESIETRVATTNQTALLTLHCITKEFFNLGLNALLSGFVGLQIQSGYGDVVDGFHIRSYSCCSITIGSPITTSYSSFLSKLFV